MSRNMRIHVRTQMFLIMVIVFACCLQGCEYANKIDPQTSNKIESIEFAQTEAFRLGDYQIGIDTYMLYAIDIIPGFVAEYGSDCMEQEEINLGWRTEEPQKAFILYLTDIVASAVACDVYYDLTCGAIDSSITAICRETAEERYADLLAAGMPKNVISEDTLYNYACSTYRLSYVISEISERYSSNQPAMQAALLGLRDSIDESFDYDKNINWELVESIDYSSVIGSQ